MLFKKFNLLFKHDAKFISIFKPCQSIQYNTSSVTLPTLVPKALAVQYQPPYFKNFFQKVLTSFYKRGGCAYQT